MPHLVRNSAESTLKVNYTAVTTPVPGNNNGSSVAIGVIVPIVGLIIVICVCCYKCRRSESQETSALIPPVTNESSSSGTTACHRPKCRTCDFVHSPRQIVGPKGSYTPRGQYTCTTSILVYCISCQRCGIHYVGKTGRCLYERFKEHLDSVSHQHSELPVARHFTEPMHTCNDMRVCVLMATTKAQLSEEEKRAILQLGTLAPGGINQIL